MSPYDPDKHHRRSIRLKGYDYSQSGAYFITIVTQNRECLFEASAAQQMVRQWWDKLPSKFPGAQADAFVVMPNHIHGIVVFVGADPRVRPESAEGQGPTHGSAPTVGMVVQWFKTMTTNEYIRGVKQQGWTPFPGKLWQRNYYEHVIRSEQALAAIRQYIADNPPRWALDRYNPFASGSDPQAADLWRFLQEDAGQYPATNDHHGQ
jgi:putative transposase